MMGTILPEEEEELHKYSIKQQCFPVYSLLLALGNPTVNLFSLDIEGLEYQVNYFTISHQCDPFQVLRSIPWSLVDIEVLLLELIHAGTVVAGSREEIHDYLHQQHYVYLATIGQSVTC